MNRCDVTAMVGHTILKPEATQTGVTRIVKEGATIGTFSAYMSPSMLSLDAPERLQVAYVVGLPSGVAKPEVRAFRATLAVADDADGIGMAISIGLVKGERFADLKGKIAAVRRAIPPPRVLKVIIEAATLTDNEIVAACRASMAAGIDFVKTSTGFHPAEDTSTHAVALIRTTVEEALEVEASDDIRDAETTLAVIEAGASRLGVSATNVILIGLED